MKKLVLFSKRLSEWHVKNLEMWIKVVFDNYTKADIEYSIGDAPSECYINYNIRFKRNKLPKDFKLRASHLEKWVKSVFWTDLEFSIKDLNGKVLYPEKKA